MSLSQFIQSRSTGVTPTSSKVITVQDGDAFGVVYQLLGSTNCFGKLWNAPLFTLAAVMIKDTPENRKKARALLGLASSYVNDDVASSKFLSLALI